MARRIGANWFDAAVTFDDFIVAPSVFYSIDGAPDVEIETGISVESYELTDNGTIITLYRGSFNGTIPEAAAGNNVVIKIYDPGNLNDVLEYDPIDVCTDVATSATISPAAASVRPGGTRQFTANFLAADNLPTDNHGSVLWSTNASGETQGSINSSTGVFTAGSAIGGPYTVTATAGELTDNAEITVREATSVRGGGTALAVGVSPHI